MIYLILLGNKLFLSVHGLQRDTCCVSWFYPVTSWTSFEKLHCNKIFSLRLIGDPHWVTNRLCLLSSCASILFHLFNIFRCYHSGFKVQQFVWCGFFYFVVRKREGQTPSEAVKFINMKKTSLQVHKAKKLERRRRSKNIKLEFVL